MHTKPAVDSRLQVFLRDPAEVMKLARLGSAHQCRLSFMRTLLRRLKREQWRFDRSSWEINEKGVGHAVYQAIGPKRTYSLVAFSHDLPDELRSDRVIAQAWDATFALFDGIPEALDIKRLEKNVPLQEAGRVSSSELSLSRANRSVRLFSAVVDALAEGRQPDRDEIENVGYLMRTTAVYGSGKFGAADRDLIEHREEIAGSFQVEMLAVWMIRAFTLDLVEQLAAVKGGDKAVVFEPGLRRCIGVGNSTGLGMAPFLINHPSLLNNWISAREQALANVRSIPTAGEARVRQFREFLARIRQHNRYWRSGHPVQIEKIADLHADLEKLDEYLAEFDFDQDHPWNALYLWAHNSLSLEGQEQLAMLLMEPYPERVDQFSDRMIADESELPMINGRMCVKALRELLDRNYGWALAIDFSENSARSRFWYVSEEKLEPRLGERFDEPGTGLELPLCVGWHVSQLYDALSKWPGDASLAVFLQENAQFRHIVRRTQQIESHPYMEIQDNLIGADLLPINMLRLKLSFFGAMKYDPRSDRWVRINMFQYAPFPHELACMPEDDWVYPPLSESRS